ncbi:AsmA family protein [Comamonas testosteroni]|uniref:AsmA family protein n=1 Tax=Comamonas testosteroni TaxID=285 RepID=UPI002DBB1FCE|nr:AsmA family protein [Comamonas testosteroni]MEB5965145.1 AsmA family protein [Comamonas testosteroni]
MVDTTGTSAPESTAAPSRRAHPWLRWAAVAMALLPALMLAAAMLVAFTDWNRLRPWINERISTTTGREFAIRGDLQVQWMWPQPLDTGWRRWLPGVVVRASDLTLSQPLGWLVQQVPGNADDKQPVLPAAPKELNAGRLPGQGQAAGEKKTAADDDDAIADADRQPPERDARTMITAANATASLRLWPLLSRHVQLDSLLLQAPDVVLARNDKGENNWTFDTPAGSGSAWSFDIGQLRISDGVLGWSDAIRNMAVRARIDTLRRPVSAGQPYGMRFGLTGYLYQGRTRAQIQAQGLAGPVLDLRQDRLRFPLRIHARAGSLQAFAEGRLDNPKTLDGLDFQVQVRGKSMADLFELSGLLLPATPPFETSGHLTGSLRPGNAVWQYEQFRGKLGQSDLSGDLQYRSAQPRPKLTAQLRSRQLRLVDLGPVIGAAPSGSSDKPQPINGKVLPQVRFQTGNWDKMDLDLHYESSHILRPEALPVQNLSVHALLDNGRLSLSPLRFGFAEGTLNLDAHVDSRARPVAAKLNGQVQSLKLSALFPKIEKMKKSLGRLDGAVAITGQGESPAQWLGTGNGSLRLYVRDGTFSSQLLDLAGLNVGSIVIAKLFGSDREVQLRCAVADLHLQQGIARPRAAKLATTEAVVEATGQINLAQEQLDLRIVPESLKWKFFSLRTPLYVRGSFARPDVGLEPGPLAARAGAAVAAAVLAPAALALVPLTVPAADDDVNCKQLLTQVRNR